MGVNANPKDLTKDDKKQMFTNEDQTVINWNGANFYKACDVFVCENSDGGSSFCVKPTGHESKIHEAMDGNTKES